jgi:hypothetical protein
MQGEIFRSDRVWRNQSRLNALACDHRLRAWRQRLQDDRGAAIIADLALCEQQDQWLAVRVADRVQLGGLASFGPSETAATEFLMIRSCPLPESTPTGPPYLFPAHAGMNRQPAR